MKVKAKVGPNGKLPTRGTAHAAGWDVYAGEAGCVEPGDQLMVKCDIFIEIEDGWFADVRPRSGLAAKHNISVTNSPGTIDSDYRGEVMVMLRNNAPWMRLVDLLAELLPVPLGAGLRAHYRNWYKPFNFEKGERIAQLVFHQVHPVAMVSVDELGSTSRGTGGFGSTGR